MCLLTSMTLAESCALCCNTRSVCKGCIMTVLICTILLHAPYNLARPMYKLIDIVPCSRVRLVVWKIELSRKLKSCLAKKQLKLLARFPDIVYISLKTKVSWKIIIKRNTAHKTLTAQAASRIFLFEIVVVVFLSWRLIRVSPPVDVGLAAWSGGSK